MRIANLTYPSVTESIMAMKRYKVKGILRFRGVLHHWSVVGAMQS